MSRRWLSICALSIFASSAAVAQEVQLKAISGFPTNAVFTRSLESFIDKVNERGKGIVQITLVGGVEAIPPKQQSTALRNGIVDLLYQPPNHYLGLLPEGDVFSATKKTPMELRANGGWDYISRIFEDKMNAHLLGWFDSGVGMHIFLINEPKLTQGGTPNLSGIKLRSTPIFSQFFESLGAINVDMAAAEIYTGLERGVISGLGTPIMTVLDFGWDKFVKYRVDPSFYQGDLLAIVNKDKWDSLSDEARQFLQDMAKEYEQESHDFWQVEQQRIREKQAEAGVEAFTLEGEGAEAYLDAAYSSSWKRLESSAPDHVGSLKEYFGD